MDLNDFRSKLSNAGGLARSNRYKVSIPVSDLLNKSRVVAEHNGWETTYFEDAGVVSKSIGERLEIFCKKAELPGVQFSVDEIRYYGEPFKFPYMPVYTDLSLSFYVGSDMAERKFWDAWMFSIMDPYSHDFNYITEYSVDIVIDQYNELDESVYQIKLFDAYPISISQMDVSYDDDNRVHECTVTCAYKRWLPTDFGWKGSSKQSIRGTKSDLGGTLIGGNTFNKV